MSISHPAIELPDAALPRGPAPGASSALPHSSDPQAQWFVLRTRSRQEKRVATDLASMGIAHYLPLVTQHRTYEKRKATLDLPLFSGYMFLHGTLDQAYQADRTRRVAQILAVPDQAGIEWELSNIHHAICSGASPDPYPYLQRGVRAEVKSGPMRGLQGVIEDRTRRDRLILQIEMLGRALSIELDGAVLEPLD